MARLIRIAFTVLKMAAPIIAWVAINSIKAMLLALISLWKGVPDTCRAIANEWVAEAIKAGWPTVWERHLRNVLFVLALLFVFIGWILLAYLTVFLLAIVF